MRYIHPVPWEAIIAIRAFHRLLRLGAAVLVFLPLPAAAAAQPAVPDTFPRVAPEVVRLERAAPILIEPVSLPSPGGSAARPQREKKQDPPDRWNISAEFSFTDQSGRKDLRLLTGGLKFSHRDKKRFELDGSLNSRYGRSGSEVVARNDYASLSFGMPRGNEIWTPSPFLYVNAERDVLRRLDLRLSGGAGARLVPYRVDGQGEGTVALALLYSFEDLRPTEEDPAPDDRLHARWNLKIQGSQEVGSGVTLQHTSTYEPVWDHMADYLLRSETGAKVMLTERLALSVGYQLNRTARPPEGVEPDDRLFKTGLIIDF